MAEQGRDAHETPGTSADGPEAGAIPADGPPVPPSEPAQAEPADADSEQQVYELSEPLPDVLTKLSRTGVVARLDKASRRGRLPGFSERDVEGLCSVAAFGSPFDKKLIVIGDQDPDGRTRLRWRLRLSMKIPGALALLLAVSVWPGEPLTNSLLVTYFGFYNDWVSNGLQTWWWYLPMSIPSVLWVWHSAMRKANTSTHQSAHETVRKIAAEIGGELTKPKLHR